MLVKQVCLLFLILFSAGCITPHQEASGRWTKPAQVEVRSPMGTNQSGMRLERCDGPAEKKPWYKFYFESDFTNCIMLTKAEQAEWEFASSRGSGPEVLSAAIIGSSFGPALAIQRGAVTSARASAGAIAASSSSALVDIRKHY